MDAKTELDELRSRFDKLGTISAMKEELRNVYKIAPDFFVAEYMLQRWCQLAQESDVMELHTMANTIMTHMDGILAYWTCNGLTSAGMEGFNNKIGWLNRQAYGYRDDEFFNLKIYDLPNIKIEKSL